MTEIGVTRGLCRNLALLPGWTTGLLSACALAMMLAPPLSAQEFPFTTDFETGDLRGWEQRGEAFRFQPTRGDNPTARGRGQPSNHQGDWWIGTFEQFQGRRGERPGTVQGDGPTGFLQSREFTIPRGALTFRIGGGAAFETRVELIALNQGGDVEFRENRVFHASGSNTETMRPVNWNLDRVAGARGFIRIVDNASGAWGHINADDFRFVPRFQVAAPERLPIAPEVIERVPPVVVTVAVPDLHGRTLQQAREVAKEAGLQIERVETVQLGFMEGRVVRQAPAPDTRLPRGGGIVVVLGPPPPVEVPGLVGRDIKEAVRILERFRLRAGRVVEEETREQRPGAVWRQAPPPGAEVEQESTVDLVVAVAPRTVPVPDLRRRLLAQAEEILLKSRLALGRVDTVESTEAENVVVRQAPPPRTEVDPGTAIDVTVTRKVRVDVPGLIGRDRSEVGPILVAARLVLAGIRERPSDRRPGTVLAQDPEPGSVVEVGTRVGIVVAVPLPPPPPEEPPVTEEPPVSEEPPVVEEPPPAEEPTVEEEPPVVEEPPVDEEPPIVEEPPPEEEPPVDEDPPFDEGGATNGWRDRIDPVWLGAVVAALVLGAGLTHWAHRRARRPSDRRQDRQKAAPQPELTFTPRPDPGHAGLRAGEPPGADFELRLRPVRDPGSQRIETPGDLTEGPNRKP